MVHDIVSDYIVEASVDPTADLKAATAPRQYPWEGSALQPR